MELNKETHIFDFINSVDLFIIKLYLKKYEIESGHSTREKTH